MTVHFASSFGKGFMLLLLGGAVILFSYSLIRTMYTELLR